MKKPSEVEKEKIFCHANIFFVGPPGSGKSSLINLLLYDRFNPNASASHGINILPWRIVTSSGLELNLNLWDFDGRSVFHNYYRIFFARQSIYVLVIDVRQEHIDVVGKYWMNVISSLSENSPIIIVGNKCENDFFRIDRQQLHANFPNIVDVVETDVGSRKGIEKVTESIQRAAQKLPQIGKQMARNFFKARKKILESEKRVMRYDDFVNLCLRLGISSKNIEKYSDIFHYSGVFLHFKSNPILRHFIFRDHLMLISGIEMALDGNPRLVNNGRYSFDFLTSLWNKSYANFASPENYIDIVQVMKNHQLCLEHEVGEYLFPQALRRFESEIALDLKKFFQIQYHYEYVPFDILPQLIIVFQDFVDFNYVWRDLAIFRNHDVCIVAKQTGASIISFWIEDSKTSRLFSLFWQTMENLNQSLYDDSVAIYVNCCCSDCITREYPYLHNYHQLRHAQSNNQHAVLCKGSREVVLIQDLLGPISSKLYKPIVRLTSKPIKIFLASSSELRVDRQYIKNYVDHENRDVDNIQIVLEIWEELMEGFSGGRLQDYFNAQLIECDIVICLLYKRLGIYTKEELDLAITRTIENKTPTHLWVFCKSVDPNDSGFNKGILEIRKQLGDNERNNIILTDYRDSADLLEKLKLNIDSITARN